MHLKRISMDRTDVHSTPAARHRCTVVICAPTKSHDWLTCKGKPDTRHRISLHRHVKLHAGHLYCSSKSRPYPTTNSLGHCGNRGKPESTGATPQEDVPPGP